MRSSRTTLVVGLVALITAALVFSFTRSEDHAIDLPASNDSREMAPGTAAMRVSIDPETGALVPGHVPVNKTEDAALAEALSQSSEGLVEVHHPDGSVSVDLQGRFQNASVARIDSSGKLQTTCVNHADAAHAFCEGSHPEVPVVEER